MNSLPRVAVLIQFCRPGACRLEERFGGTAEDDLEIAKAMKPKPLGAAPMPKS